MSAPLNQSVLKAGQILETLFDGGFQTKTLPEIADATCIPWSTAYRLLKTWETLGWVEEIPGASEGKTAWRLSRKIVAIADAYEQHALTRRQRVEHEFFQTTGRELSR